MLVHNDEKKQKSINELTEVFSDLIFDKKVKDSDKALNYFLDRGIDESLIRKFKLGWYPPDRNTRYCDKNLKGRVIFPVIDEYGDTVIFSGRDINYGKGRYSNYWDWCQWRSMRSRVQ